MVALHERDTPSNNIYSIVKRFHLYGTKCNGENIEDGRIDFMMVVIVAVIVRNCPPYYNSSVLLLLLLLAGAL